MLRVFVKTLAEVLARKPNGDHRKAVCDGHAAFWSTIEHRIDDIKRMTDPTHRGHSERRTRAKELREYIKADNRLLMLTGSTQRQWWTDVADAVPNTTDEYHLQLWQSVAHEMVKSYTALFTAEKTQSFAQCVCQRCEDNDMKTLFHWVKDMADIPVDTFIDRGSGLAICDPVAKADSEADKWEGTWSEGATAARRQEQTVRELVADHKHRGENKPLDTPPTEIRGICRSFPSKTCISTDWWEFDEVAELPDEALLRLVVLMDEGRRRVAMPYAALVPMMATIAKKKLGETRAIGLLASWHRIDAKRDYGAIRQWDTENGHIDDSAKPGSSAQTATTDRALTLELAHHDGDTSCTLLWDLRTFFDKVQPHRMATEARAVGFPPSPTAMSLYAGLAPRRMTMKGCVSRLITNVSALLSPAVQGHRRWRESTRIGPRRAYVPSSRYSVCTNMLTISPSWFTARRLAPR